MCRLTRQQRRSGSAAASHMCTASKSRSDYQADDAFLQFLKVMN